MVRLIFASVAVIFFISMAINFITYVRLGTRDSFYTYLLSFIVTILYWGALQLAWNNI